MSKEELIHFVAEVLVDVISGLILLLVGKWLDDDGSDKK